MAGGILLYPKIIKVEDRCLLNPEICNRLCYEHQK
jgi:hypothetical protein